MNKVYISLWNDALGTWVAASEISSSRNRSKNKIIKNSLLAFILSGSSAYACTINNSSPPTANIVGIECQLNGGIYDFSANNTAIRATDGARIIADGDITINSTGFINNIPYSGPIVSNGNNSYIELKNINLTRTITFGAGALILARDAGQIIINGDVIANGSAPGSGFTGINSMRDNSKFTINGNVDIQFTGGSPGTAAILAELGSKNTLTINGALTVKTEGQMAVYSDHGGAVYLKDIDLRVGIDDTNNDGNISGLANTYGQGIRTANTATVQYENAKIETANGNAIFATDSSNITSNGLNTLIVHKEFISANENLSNSSGTAVFSLNSSKISLGSAKATINANNGVGLKAKLGGTISTSGDVEVNSGLIKYTTGGTLNDTASNVIGIYALTGSSITIGGNLKTKTTGYGAISSGSNSRITAASADITTAAMTGLKADLAGVVNITGDATVVANAAINADGTLGASLLDAAMRNVTADGSGSQLNIGGTFTTTTAGIGALASNSGKVSIGNALITVSTPLTTTAGAVSGIGLQATTAGKVALGTATLKVNVANGLGLNATGANSEVTSTGDVTVTGTKAGVTGAKAEAQGVITLGGKLTTSTQAVGAYATGSGSKLTAASADITTAAMTGLKADLAGVVNITGDATVVANAAINADGTLGASLLDTAMRNVTADGSGSQLNIGGTFTTTTAGIGALASNSGQIDIGQAKITVVTATPTGSPPGTGVQATTQGSVIVRGGTIDVEVANGIGAQAKDAGVLQWTAGTVNVKASNGVGLQVMDAGSAASMNSGTINLQGDNGVGLQALNNGLIKLQDVNAVINISGSNGTALNTQGTLGAEGKITGNGAIKVASTAQGSQALLAQANSSIELSSGRLTSNTKGTGVTADGVNAKITLSEADITSDEAYGLHAKNTGVVDISQQAEVTTKTANQHAVLVESGGRLTGKNFLLNTSGANAAGLAVVSASTTTSAIPDADVEFVQVRTTGAGADGIKIGSATNSGYVKVSGSVNIAVTGTPSIGTGCNVGAGVCITGTNSKFELQGAHASNIVSSGNALHMANGADLDVSLKNAALSVTRNLAAIDINAATGNSKLFLENSEVNTTNSQNLLQVSNGSTAQLETVASRLFGNVDVASGNNFQLSLTKNSYLSGSFTGIANLNIDATSTWSVAKNSNLSKISNDGTIDFLDTFNATGNYQRITVNNYEANDGRLNVNTYLSNDASSSDILEIKNGPVLGSTSVYVTNRGGLGAYSTGKGILVVHANGATTTESSFKQGNVVSAGAYDYTLYRNPDQSWYLFSSKNDNTPDYSNESSAISVLPPFAKIYGIAILGSWRERMGGMAYAKQENMPRSAVSPLWVRIGGGKGTHTGGTQYQVTSTSVAYSPDYKYNFNFLQVGGDVFQRFASNGARHVAGAYFTTGKIYGDVYDYDELTAERSKTAAQATVDNISLGTYWTYITPNGSYVDLVGQYTNHDLTVQGTSDAQLGSGHTWTTSAEVGKAFILNEAWSLVPQAQVRWQDIRLKPLNAIASQKNVGQYDFNNRNSLEGRLGMELRYKTKPLNNAWLRLDVSREFKGDYITSYKSIQTSSERPQFTSTSKGTSIEFLAGMELEVDKGVAVYGTTGYKIGISTEKDRSWNMQIGLRWGF